MTVILGHASIDETGAASGGAAGDQTGRELCTRSWYDKGWNLLLRPRSADLAEKSARSCALAVENECIGYDQSARNTLYSKAQAVSFDLSKITTPCECDCSSLMHVCAICGGANLSYEGNGLTTRTMASAFVSSGDYEKLTAPEYLRTPDYLRRGDILLKEGSHTAMVLQGAARTGLGLPRLARGDSGQLVIFMQLLLLGKGYELPRWGADGNFGAETENAILLFQEDMNMVPDGICTDEVYLALADLGGVG